MPVAETDALVDRIAGMAPDDAEREIAQLRLKLAAHAPSEALSPGGAGKIGASGKRLAPVSADSIEPVSVEWLWDGLVPLGAITLLYGQEGDGKSTLSMMIAAMATRGELPGDLYGTPTRVEIFAYEDDPGAVLVPRLRAAGADLSMVGIHPVVDGGLTMPDDADLLRDHLQASGARLLIIDPLPDVLADGLKDNNNHDVRSALVPLQQVGADLGVAIIGVSHPNKGASDAANKVIGSKAFRAVPRSVLIYGRDPEDPDGSSRIVAVSKANYAAKTARKIEVESVQVDGVKHPQPRARVVGDSRYSDSDVLGAGHGVVARERGHGAGGQQQRAEGLILRLLEDGGGEIPASTAYAAGEAAGIPEATMRRARKAVGVQVVKHNWQLDGLSV